MSLLQFSIICQTTRDLMNMTTSYCWMEFSTRQWHAIFLTVTLSSRWFYSITELDVKTSWKTVSDVNLYTIFGDIYVTAKQSDAKQKLLWSWQWQTKYLISSSCTSFSSGNLLSHTQCELVLDIALCWFLCSKIQRQLVLCKCVRMFNGNQQSKRGSDSRISISFSQWPCLLLILSSGRTLCLSCDLFWFLEKNPDNPFYSITRTTLNLLYKIRMTLSGVIKSALFGLCVGETENFGQLMQVLSSVYMYQHADNQNAKGKVIQKSAQDFLIENWRRSRSRSRRKYYCKHC